MTAPSASTLLNRLTAKAKFRHMLVLENLLNWAACVGRHRRCDDAAGGPQLVMERRACLRPSCSSARWACGRPK